MMTHIVGMVVVASILILFLNLIVKKTRSTFPERIDRSRNTLHANNLPDFDALLRNISTTDDTESKSRAVRRYLAGVRRLDARQQASALTRLADATEHANLRHRQLH